MESFWVAVFLLLLILVLTDAKFKARIPGPLKPANRLCKSVAGYRMLFPERIIKNYAQIENAIAQGLDAVTLCLLVKDNPKDSSNEKQCAYSYAVLGQHNEFSFCPSPTLQVLINGASSKTHVDIEYGEMHHICFTWKSSNGKYSFLKDGKMVASGTDFQQGHTIRPGGTLVLGQDQDMLAADFDVKEAFVGELAQLNVRGKVLPRRAIVNQHNQCHIGKGSVNWWAQFKNSVHGGVRVIEK